MSSTLDFTSGKVGSIGLPSQGELVEAGTAGIVSGWGTTSVRLDIHSACGRKHTIGHIFFLFLFHFRVTAKFRMFCSKLPSPLYRMLTVMRCMARMRSKLRCCAQVSLPVRRVDTFQYTGLFKVISMQLFYLFQSGGADSCQGYEHN